MKLSTPSWWLAIPLLLAAGTTAATQTAGSRPVEYADEYRSGDYGRVRVADSGLTIVRAEWDHERGIADPGGINSPIFPGDSVSTDPGQRVEVQLAGGTLVWIEGRTSLEFLALPDPYAEFSDHAVLQLKEGVVRLATLLADEEEFRIDTPAASIYPLGDADVRVEVTLGGGTRIASRRGVVEVVGQGGSVLLRGGMRTEVEPGTVPNDPLAFNTLSEDGFDRWVSTRRSAYESAGELAGSAEAYEGLPEEVQPYYPELSASGSWSYVDDYGYVWQPTGVGPDWKPYYDGYWGYGPHGYFWISNEPWGWAPYHYGRWSWIGGRGWCWSPGSVFAGAWVSWSVGSVYVGWSPLSYWNYPGYRSAWHYGYYDPYCWTFVSYRHFGHRYYSHYTVGWDHVRYDARRSAVVTRPPRYSPRRLASSDDARRGAYHEAVDDTRYRLQASERDAARRRSFRTDEYRSSRPATEGRDRREATPPPSARQRYVTQSRYPRKITAERPAAPRTAPAPRTRASDERLQGIYRKMAQPRQTRETPTVYRPSPRTQKTTTRPSPTRRPTSGASPRPRTTTRPQPVKRPTSTAKPRVRPSTRSTPAKRPTAKPRSSPSTRPKPVRRTTAKPKSRPTTRPSPAKRPAAKPKSRRR